MAVGSISQYFESKERLFTAVLTQLSAEFEGTWQAGVDAAGADPARALQCFVDSYFEPAICQRKKIAVWYAFWGEVKARPQYRDVCAGYDRRHDEALEALCQALITQGSYRHLDARRAAKVVASVCHGLWLELLTGTDGLRRPELKQLARLQLASFFPDHLSVPLGDGVALRTDTDDVSAR